LHIAIAILRLTGYASYAAALRRQPTGRYKRSYI